MSLYIYPSCMRAEVSADLAVAKAVGHRTIGVNPADMRHVVRTLSYHDQLLLPASVEHHTADVERIKQVAYLMGLQVRPIQHNNPTAAPAARQTQPSAAVGNP